MAASTTDRASFIGSDGFLAGNLFLAGFRLWHGLIMPEPYAFRQPLGDSNFTSTG